MKLPPGSLLFDTSVYIRYIREGAFEWLAEDGKIVQRSILTVVVAAELYAGARDAEEKQQLDALCQWHSALGTLTCPGVDSWLQAGILLGRYARVYGGIRMADHFRDVLIALEAARHRATLITENLRDFQHWQKLLRAAGRRVEVLDVGTPS